MKVHQKILLILFLFIILLCIKNNVYGASTITYNNWEGAPEYATIPSLVLPDGTVSYLTAMNNARNEVIVVVPLNPGHYIASYASTSEVDGTYNRLSAYNSTSKILTDLQIYKSTFSIDTQSWSSWSSSTSASVSAYAPGNTGYIYKSKFNILLYCNGVIVGNEILSSGASLPEGIKLTDNISIWKGNNGSLVLCKTDLGNMFYETQSIWCNNSSSVKVAYDYYTYNSSSNAFVYTGNTTCVNASKPYTVMYSTNNISRSYNYPYGSTDFFSFYYNEDYVFPYIADVDAVLENLDDIEKILIFPGSLEKVNLPMSFYITKIVDNTISESVFQINLDTLSPYYLAIETNINDYWWEIPTSLFKTKLQTGQEYLFVLQGVNNYDEFSVARSITYAGTSYVPPEGEENPFQETTDAIINQTQKIEEQTNVIINQTEKIEEQTEVNKSIFARIGDILSYINPLSENFFAYKLIDLLIDALKSLFVPDEGFFNNWIADINDYFSSRFGMVYSSIDFVVDFLTRLADISSNLNTDYTIHIPEFKLFDTTLIPEYSYNLSDLLENDTFKNIHTIYLCIIDVIMFLWLLAFARNTFAEIFGGRFIDDVFGAVEADSVSYSKFERHQDNKTRYIKEQNLKRYKNK